MRKSFIVYGKEIKIKPVKKLMDIKDALATYSWRDSTICYDPRLKGDELLQTMLHELFHAYCDRVGLHQMPSWSLDKEELIADGFTQIIIENFKLTRR